MSTVAVTLMAACAWIDLPAEYFHTVYGGPAPTLTYNDIDVVSFDAMPLWLRLRHLPLLFNASLPLCGKPGGLAWNINDFHPLCQPLVVRALKESAPAHTWVEVTHAKMPEPGKAAWFYVARGSGIFVYTGRTVAYRSHAAAALDLLNVTCAEYGTCYDLYPALWQAGRRHGYDSIQFTQHCDYACCDSGLCMTELVVLNSTGENTTCPIQFKTGWNHSKDCICDGTQPFANCGVSTSTCHIAFGIRYVVAAACAGSVLLSLCLFCTCALRTKRKTAGYTTIQ